MNNINADPTDIYRMSTTGIEPNRIIPINATMTADIHESEVETDEPIIIDVVNNVVFPNAVNDVIFKNATIKCAAIKYGHNERTLYRLVREKRICLGHEVKTRSYRHHRLTKEQKTLYIELLNKLSLYNKKVSCVTRKLRLVRNKFPAIIRALNN
jgi:hypothetical protein